MKLSTIFKRYAWSALFRETDDVTWNFDNIDENAKDSGILFSSFRLLGHRYCEFSLSFFHATQRLKGKKARSDLDSLLHICYLPAGRSVLGKIGLEVLSTYPRPRTQFFPIRTDLGRQITCLLFSSVEYFVSGFCVEFSLQPFSNLVYACVWHLGNRKSKIWIHNCCFLGHYLHFTFFAVKKKLLEKTRKLEN